MWGEGANAPSPHPCGDQGNASPPRKKETDALAERPEKRGENRVTLRTQRGGIREQVAMGSEPEMAPRPWRYAVERTTEPS
jgi:hypothetical protein